MPHRREIFDGDEFNSDDLELGEIVLVKPEPVEEPEEWQEDEPWARLRDMAEDDPIRDWVRERLSGD